MTNERKTEILSLLEDGALGLSLTNSSELLRRYHRNGLLVRQRVTGPGAPPRAYGYRITGKGIDRLVWLLNGSQKGEWDVEFQ